MRRINHSSRFIEEFNNPEIPKVSMSELCTTFIDGDWMKSTLATSFFHVCLTLLDAAV